MAADPIPTMTRAISEVLEASAGGEIWCASFEVSGDPARWMQITSDTINLAYPPLEPPLQWLHAHGGADAVALELREWQAHAFATFEVPDGAGPDEIARIADALFRSVLGCSDGYGVEVSKEKLDDGE